MGHPHNSDKRARIVAALHSGRPVTEIAQEFGVHPYTVRKYAVELGHGDGRVYKGNEPRCGCGLLLPCTCGGELHAVDFARDGYAAPVLSASLMASFREI